MISNNLYGVYILIIFFTFIWGFYNIIIRPSDLKKSHFMGGCLLHISDKFKKYFPFINREGKIENENCLDKWALGHFLLYLIIGLFFPDEYIAIIIFSVLCEVFEYFIKCRSKLSDIFVNFLGYFIGSVLYNYHTIRIILKPTYYNIYYISSLFVILLYMLAENRKNTLKNISDISTKEEFI